MLQDAFRPGLSCYEACQVIRSLPVQDKELSLLRILRIHRQEVLRNIEQAAAAKNTAVSFRDIRFMVPR